jgi:glycerol-3-phosphate dehydrogenase
VLRRDVDLLAGREHDVVVVGGGIHGAAAAWEASSRGLSVALVEAQDFGGGASWNSLKTIHGGLRHLQRLDVASLRESARERRALLAIAPALVHPLAFLVPAHGYGLKGRAALAAGLALNDLLTPDRNQGLPADRRLPRGRALTRAQAVAGVPELSATGLSGGALWWDAQVESSERLVLAFLHAAAGAGAEVANRIEVTSLVRDGRRVRGVAARDALTGRAFEVRARMVLNAGGAAASALTRTAGIDRPPVPHLRAVNLVLRRALVREVAVGARFGDRYLFCVPWRDRSIVGTAYAPEATPGAVLAEEFAEDAARAFAWAGLGPEDVTLVHEGRVPAGRGGGGLLTRSRVVDHEVEDAVPGLLTVVAAKYTTARATAEVAVDLVRRRLGVAAVPSRTAVTPLPEARLLDGRIEENARRAVREEMALSLADAVLRRLDLGTAGPAFPPDVDSVARVMAQELGWDPARVAAERTALDDFYADHRLT